MFGANTHQQKCKNYFTSSDPHRDIQIFWHIFWQNKPVNAATPFWQTFAVSQRRKYPNATWQAICPTDLKQTCQHTSCSKFSVKPHRCRWWPAHTAHQNHNKLSLKVLSSPASKPWPIPRQSTSCHKCSQQLTKATPPIKAPDSLQRSWANCTPNEHQNINVFMFYHFHIHIDNISMHDLWLTFFLTFFSDISPDISSDISSAFHLTSSSDIISEISMDTSSEIYSDISSDILVWHIFWHFYWHIFWHFFWHSFSHIFWHFFWHFFWHSFLTYLLTFLLTFLSDISSDIPSDNLSDILSDILFWHISDISSHIPSGSWGPVLPTPHVSSPGEVRRCPVRSRAPRLRSGAAHCTLELHVEVRRWQREGRRRRRRRRRRWRRRRKRRTRRRRRAYIKSSNPHLTGGEKSWEWVQHSIENHWFFSMLKNTRMWVSHGNPLIWLKYHWIPTPTNTHFSRCQLSFSPRLLSWRWGSKNWRPVVAGKRNQKPAANYMTSTVLDIYDIKIQDI